MLIRYVTKKMIRINRRVILRAGLASATLPGASILMLGGTPDQVNGEPKTDGLPGDQSNVHAENARKGSAMKIQYLEIVTRDVDAACALYSQMHGVTFGEADQKLGGARTAKLAGGGMLGIRAPLRPTEKPVVRPYVLVNDIKASVAAAAKTGAKIAMEPTKIADYGQFAIVIHGGIESGLWQL
jgi:predicted enzyme related to lactoylglutathione lyase